MLIYEYKLDAHRTQYARMDEAIRVGQFVRNKCLRLWMDGRGGENILANDLQVYCSQLAKEFPFAACLNAQARQASADRSWQAISRFYSNCREHKPGKKGYPRFRHDSRSVEYKQTGWKLDAEGKHLTFTDGCGIGRVRLVGTREITTFPLNQIKRVRLVRRADGYYAQFVVQAERRMEHVPTGKPIGIDVGLKSYYTDSDGTTVENPRYLRKSEHRLQLLSKRLSRKSVHHKMGKKPKQNHAAHHRTKYNKYPRQFPASQEAKEIKGTQQIGSSTQPYLSGMPIAPLPDKQSVRLLVKQSANWQKARSTLAKEHLHIQRQREDFARKQANALVSSHDLIALEALQVQNMVGNRHLAKSISDAGWAGFRQWVEYYGKLHDIPVIAVPPQYTTQRCSRCGALVKKSLSMRTHACPVCGLVLDRDHNAARAILDEGMARLPAGQLPASLASWFQEQSRCGVNDSGTVGHPETRAT